jgi:hypothetical protein
MRLIICLVENGTELRTVLMEVEQFVDAEVAAMDKKVKEHTEKKTKARPTNSDLSITFPKMEKWLEVFEGFMKKFET